MNDILFTSIIWVSVNIVLIVFSVKRMATALEFQGIIFR